jgi:hypothetical protein
MVCLIRVLLAPAVAAYAQFIFAADIPVEVLFKQSEFLQMTLSPDGKKTAALVPF